jgi:molybdate transport system ATP-binding protein
MLEVWVDFRRGDHHLELETRLEKRVVGLFGRSGAGKTTLLHVIAGLLAPRAGRIALDGQVLFDSDRGINLPARHRRVGVVFQDARLFPHYRVRGNLRYGRPGRAAGERRFSFHDVVDLLELAPLLDRRPGGLSGGERQRVALGRTLLSSPRLLLMDEPLASLDFAMRAQIIPFLQRVRDAAGIPIVYITHDLSEVLQLTDYLLMLESGRAVGVGRYRDLALDHAVLGLTPRPGLLNVLEMTVVEHDAKSGCTRFAFTEPACTAGELKARFALQGRHIDAEIGCQVSVAVRPEDIALASNPIEGISVRNQFPAVIQRFAEHEGMIVVEVDAGAPLLVEVSSGSFDRLGLATGKRVHCLVKANAVRILGPCREQ